MPKPNTGSLRRNAKKEKDTHPDAKGSCNINGQEFWISGWIREEDDGSKWTSLSFTPKEEKQSAKPVAKPAARPGYQYPGQRDPDLEPEDDGSGIPF